MHDVNICFVSENGLKAKVVRGLTECQYDHVYVEFFSREWKSWQAIDVDEYGAVVQVPALSLKYPKGSTIKFRAKDSFSDAMMKRQDIMGARDWGGLFGGLFKMIVLRLFGHTIRRPWHSTGKYFCSEVVAILLGTSDNENYVKTAWASSVSDILSYSRVNLERVER